MTVTIKSKEQLLGTWVRRIKNNTDITDFQTGGALVTLMEAIAQQVYQAQLSVLKVLEVTEVDNLTEKRLDDLAESLKIPNGQGGIGRQAALQATGSVVVGSAFTKISTRAYAGKPAPYAGSKVLYVQDASEMFAKTPVNGKIYIGRNTIDTFEGPLSYSSISTTGTYWIINLVDPLTKDHPYTDEIVLAQGGDRNINASTVVQVPAYADAPAIQFTTDVAVVLPDGEDSVTVPVTCTQFGVVGNVASGAITEFATVPFAGAVVSNQQTFVNGSDTESDASLRQRIKDYPNTLARGTVGAMNAALLSVVDADTKKKVTSASVIRPLEPGEPTTVYIDDGTLLEPVFAGQDYELLLAKASGLEQGFKTALAPITPAVVSAAKEAPYVLEAGMTITFLIDNIPYVYTITPSNYKDLTAATAYEIVRDLNADPEGILDFRVTENGTKIVAIDRTNTSEEITVISGSLQDILGFPTISQRPIYLYKNGVLQSFKGKTATVSSNPFSSWSIQTSYTGLSATIDGVFVNIDSIAEIDFQSRFGVSIAVATADNWREVLQAKIPGVTVIFQDNRFIITSNKENSSSSEIVINSGTWVGSASIFSATLSERSSVGASKDYTFNRYTGDIRFVSRLTAGDIIEIASLNTRAFVKSISTPTGKYDISNDYPGFGPAKFIVTVDDSTSVKATGNPNSGLIQVTNIDTNELTVSLKDKLGNGLFINAEIGDYLYLTSIKNDDTTPISSPFKGITDAAVGFYRIKKIVKGTSPVNSDTVIIEVSDYQAASAFVLSDEYDAAYKGAAVFKVFSSSAAPQVVTLPSSTAILVEDVVASVNSQIIGAEAERTSGQYFFLRTNTYVNGSLSVVATFGKANNIFAVSAGENLQAHVGSSNSGNLDNSFPVITESVLATTPALGMAAREYLKVQKNYTDITQTSDNPIIQADSSVTTYPIGFQELWVTGKLFGWTGRSYNNETTVPFQGFLRTDSFIRPIGAVTVTSTNINRYSNISFRLQDLAVTPYDKFVVEMDLDSSNKTVNLPLYKKAIISDEQLIGAGRGQKYQFTLKDPEDFDKEFFDVTSPFKNFDFNDFKIVGKSVGVYKFNSTGVGPNEPALVIRSTTFGGANRIKLNVLYPQSPSQPDIKVSHSNSYGTEEVLTTVNVEMPSQAVIPSTIFNTGTYKVTGVSTANNLTDITLSTQADAVTATAKMEDYPSFSISFLARASGFPGVLGNNIELVIQDSGHTGSPGTVQMISQSTKKVILDLNGSTPAVLALTTALSASTYLESASGTGSLALKTNAYNYVAEAAAKISNPYYTLTFNQIDFSPKIRGASGNLWSFKCVDTGGSGPAVASVNTGTKLITVDLKGQNDFPLSSLQALLNGVSGLNGAITVTGTFIVGGSPVYLSTSAQTFFSGGVTKQNTIYTSDGVDATDGIFGSGLYSVNNLLQISGIQTTASMPTGVWPIIAKPSIPEIKIRVPDYSGLSSAVYIGKQFNASEYQIQSYPILPKTAQNLADALNAYLPDAPVVTAEILGLSTTDVLMPGGSQVPRATYINYTNTGTLSSSVVNPTEALKFHTFSANRSSGASIYDYSEANGWIKSVSQSIDSIFPAGTSILGTSYSSIGEEIYLLPTNTATFSRWANFAPASAMPIQANVSRVDGASKVQISSKLRGTKGAVYAKETLANKYQTTVLDAASAENGSAYFSLLTSQTKQLPRNSLVKITNALTTDLLRPFRVASPVANLTTANTINEKTWVRTNAKIVYQQVDSTHGRLYFARNGQAGTIAGISLGGTEPLTAGAILSVQYNTPATGLATVTLTNHATESLSARIGDMMYIHNAVTAGSFVTGTSYKITTVGTTNFTLIGASSNTVGIVFTATGAGSGTGTAIKAADVELNCHPLDSGLVMSSGVYSNTYGLTGYPGYPVVQVTNSKEVVIAAPNLTQNYTVTLNAATSVVFVPSVYTEKNIKTNYKAGPRGVEILGGVGTSGTHGEAISGVVSYGILKKLSSEFSALILSNTSDNTLPPTASNDTMLLAECGVNTDDHVFLNGFGAGADGQYQLVAHDGKNTAILYNSTLPLEDVVHDSDTRNTTEVGKTWWGKQITVTDNAPNDYTIDPRPVRVVDAESVVPGCKLSVASAAGGTSNWFPQALVGVWNITKIGFYGPSSSICSFIEFEVPTGAPATAQLIIVAAANEANIGFIEKTPFSAFRLVQGWSIDPKDTENSQVYITPSKSYQKISNSLGTEVECMHKLGYETVPKTGIDGYKIFSGLVREAQRTLDGVPTSISRYPGIKSTGTDVSVLPPIPRAVAVTFRIRTRDGLSINVIAGIVRSSVVSFVSSLGLGQSVILSELISLVQDIPGVVSVEVVSTLPEAVDGKIAVADNEKPVIIDPATNISVGQ